MRKIGIIYHRIDCDGLCCYAVLREYLETFFQDADIEAIPYNHGDELPCLKGLSMVYMADISFPPEEMVKFAIDKNPETPLVWIDHHQTAIEDSVKYGYSEVEGLRREGVGACELCWEYLYPNQDTPKFVKFISTFDVFDKKRFPWDTKVLPFQYGLRTSVGLDRDLFYEAYRRWSFDKILVSGNAVLQYVRQNGARAAKSYGFEVTLAGSVKALCLLTAEFGTIPVEETAREMGCEVIINANRLDARHWKVSCFAVNGLAPINLGRYLKDTYGGGGHHDAAGAVIELETAMKLFTECTL